MAQYLDASATTGVLRVENNTTSAKRYQILVDTWAADANGEKVRTPNSDITFYPSLVQLEPGKTQAVRWKRNSPSASGELVYLITVRESGVKSGEAIEGMQVDIEPEFLLPWAFTPPGAASKLSADYQAGQLTLRNTGTAAARISDLVFGDNPQPPVLLLLPGERVLLPMKQAAPTVRFKLGKTDQTLTLD
ncbi:fimbria/pilus periplasmic chaperone [Luteimonas sp. MC1750]|uniref:fimbrial biogenesis chaperone n=1 Tax=Luteimonas sp. MC1750 TaxID=2799326 RepID=UPI0018F0B8EB|nr:fimbria/pilus periplasmic chaperone [Luteimonas sp. MC1750]MBJ6983993.1 molecular chaperone [Luteimonas sp. MC1750]QQO06805.1 molecular chaperone [Luteimonas sp. MC1750]